MPIYKAPLNDFRFVLYDLLDIERLTALPGFEHATPDVVDMALAEGARFAEQVLFPLNRSGDAEGCRFENGVVRTPAGFREAYQAFVDGGWVGVAADPAHGGQGLPGVVNSALDEVLCAANLSFAVYPGLTRAAYDAIRINGDDHLKRTYLDKLAEGRWTGTMCLTEPQAGSDVGLTRARAVPDGDGSYTLTGTKVFISSGEHDLAENIIHMVLARLPGAPPGTRGISMFLVPKFLPQEADGGENGAIVPGRRNAVSCGGIEHKMGLHGAATCTMNFDGATAWLVGRPHKGMRAMFVMMNAARLVVGLHALGIAEASYQSARAHARERLQGRALPGAKTPGRPADPIIVHPDIRRSLLIMKAFTEGGRALALWVALHGDLHTHHPDPEVRRAAGDLVSLMTPVVKAYLTDMGVETANLGVQVLGLAYRSPVPTEVRVQLEATYLGGEDGAMHVVIGGDNGIAAIDIFFRRGLPDVPLLADLLEHVVEHGVRPSVGAAIREAVHVTPCHVLVHEVENSGNVSTIERLIGALDQFKIAGGLHNNSWFGQKRP